MKRGDLCIATLSGDYGKPRPVLVVQGAKSFLLTDSVTICLITSKIVEGTMLRVDIEPSETTGLGKPSQVQADKLQTVRIDRLKRVIGKVGDETMVSVNLALAFHLDLHAPS